MTVRTARLRLALVSALPAALLGGVALAACNSPGRSGGAASTSAQPGTSATAAPPTTDADEAPDAAAVGATPPPGASGLPAASGASCRTGNPLANVYHPYRLHVVRPCLTVTGTVVAVRHESDGDIHLNVRLDAPYAGLINQRNVTGEGGALVTEVVPADEAGCTPGQPPRPAQGSYDYGICTGADEVAPPDGAHVAVTGPYVLDADHGWMEIHPVWSFGTAAGPAPTGASPAAPAATAAPAPAAAPGGVRITAAPASVAPGQTAGLSAQASPGASCSLDVVLPSGRHSTAAGLGAQTADAGGGLTWTWRIGSTTGAGTATATVTCPGGSASATFQIT